MAINLDDDFLDDVGLGDMPRAERGAFLKHILEIVEECVGRELSDGLSDDQLGEFEAILDRDGRRVAAWLDANVPDFQEDPLFQRTEGEMGPNAKLADVVCAYASTK